MLYNGFLISRDLAGEWKDYRSRMAEMSSLMREARDLNATMENKVVKLQTITEEERKNTEEAKIEDVVATERCSGTVKRFGDLRKATEVREDHYKKMNF